MPAAENGMSHAVVERAELLIAALVFLRRLLVLEVVVVPPFGLPLVLFQPVLNGRGTEAEDGIDRRDGAATVSVEHGALGSSGELGFGVVNGKAAAPVVGVNAQAACRRT